LDKDESITQEQLEEIERFLQQEMPVQEKQAFLARISVDIELKKKTGEMQLIFLGLQEASLQERLDDFHKGLTTGIKGQKLPAGKLLSMKRWLAAAALIGVIAVSALLIFFRASKEEALFAKYFQPDAGLISAMSTSDNYFFDRAMIDYKTGNYEAAIKTWDSLQAIQSNNDTLNYFLGSVYLATEQTDSAILYLQKVTASPEGFFTKDAYWYTGLALLKQKKIKESISYIEQSAHPQKDALLLRLKK